MQQTATPAPVFLTSASLARFSGLDRRTVDHRLTRAGLDPDALLQEPHGIVSLWNGERLAVLLEAVARDGSLPIRIILPNAISSHNEH